MFIRTAICPAEGPSAHSIPMVFFHGFGGCNPSFSFFFKELQGKLPLYSFDMVGFNLSSRPPFKAKEPEEALDYYLDAFERWREKMGIEVMYITAFSFGGYLASNYVARNPHRVRHLLLLSPAGFSARPHNLNTSSMPMDLKINETLKKRRLAPTQAIQVFSPFSRFLINNILVTRKFQVPGMIEAYQDYAFENLKYQVVGEKGVQVLLDYGMFSPKPIVAVFMKEEYDIPTGFFTGETDWNKKEPFIKFISQVSEAKRSLFYYEEVPNAGHGLPSDNTRPIFEYIYRRILGANQSKLPNS